MDEECFVNCKSMRTQSMEQMNSCSVGRRVDEDIGDNGWIASLPGQHHVDKKVEREFSA